MGDREILETYSNSASKNTSETDIFPHGPKSLLTSVISHYLINGAIFRMLYFDICVYFYLLVLSETLLNPRGIQ